MLNDLPRVFWTPDSNIMPVDSAVDMEGRLITEDYPVTKIIIFQEFQHVYTEDSAKLFVIFSEWAPRKINKKRGTIFFGHGV